MKKILTTLAFVAISGAACATDVSVSAVRDYTLDKNGTRVALTSGKITGSATTISGAYNRYAVSTGVELFQVGPVKVGGSVAGVYQDTSGKAANGYGLTGGLLATVPLAKNISMTAGVERFVGQSRVNAFNGTTASVGVAYRF